MCEGLTVPALIVNNIETPKQSRAVSVCPGPNLAYYSKIATLREMVDHIYGRIDLITDARRPNLFVKELGLYIDYLQKKMDENGSEFSAKDEEFYNLFSANLLEGIGYYKKMISDISEESETTREKIKEGIEKLEQRLLAIFTVTVELS